MLGRGQGEPHVLPKGNTAQAMEQTGGHLEEEPSWPRGGGHADAEGCLQPAGRSQERGWTLLGHIKLPLFSGVRWKPQEEFGLRSNVIRLSFKKARRGVKAQS